MYIYLERWPPNGSEGWSRPCTAQYGREHFEVSGCHCGRGALVDVVSVEQQNHSMWQIVARWRWPEAAKADDIFKKALTHDEWIKNWLEKGKQYLIGQNYEPKMDVFQNRFLVCCWSRVFFFRARYSHVLLTVTSSNMQIKKTGRDGDVTFIPAARQNMTASINPAKIDQAG